MTPKEFSERFPNFERRNQATIKRQHDTMVKVNENLDKEFWKSRRWTEEHRKRQAKKFSCEVKQFWLDPNRREIMTANNRANLENHWKNPEFIRKHKLRMSAQMSKLWDTPGFKERYSLKFATDKEWKQKRHDNMIRRWQDVDYRNAQVERLSYSPQNPSRKLYYMSDGTSVVLRSSWEFRLYQVLLQKKIPFQYESLRIPYVYKTVKHTYVPDFYLPDLNLIIEVKPKHLWNDEIVLIKLEATKALGYKVKLLDLEGIKALQFSEQSICSSTTIESITNS